MLERPSTASMGLAQGGQYTAGTGAWTISGAASTASLSPGQPVIGDERKRSLGSYSNDQGLSGRMVEPIGMPVMRVINGLSWLTARGDLLT